MKDLFNHVTPKRVIAPVAGAGDNTARVGQIIDGLGFDSLTYLIAAGNVPDADVVYTVLLEESDDSGMAGAVAVDDADLIGTEQLAGFQFDSDNLLRKLGYKGAKRYTRMTITPANNTGAELLCVIALLGHPHQWPTPNPPT